MRGKGRYRPVALCAEIFARALETDHPLIVRNLHLGCHTFATFRLGG